MDFLELYCLSYVCTYVPLSTESVTKGFMSHEKEERKKLRVIIGLH